MIINNIFDNWNKVCYIANVTKIEEDDYGHQIKICDNPASKYMMNYQPAGGEYDIALYGAKINKVYRAIVPIKFKDKIKEGDIAYLDGAKPTNEVEGTYGSTGNYIVDSARPQNTIMTIYFKMIEK